MIGFGLSEGPGAAPRPCSHVRGAGDPGPCRISTTRSMEYPWEVIRKAHEIGLNQHPHPGALGRARPRVSRRGDHQRGARVGLHRNRHRARGETALALEPVISGASDAILEKIRRSDDRRKPIMAGLTPLTEPGAGSDVGGAAHRGREEGRPLRARRLEDVDHERRCRRLVLRARVHGFATPGTRA
jgi:hypothetical protein